MKTTADIMHLVDETARRYEEKGIPTGDLYRGITHDAWANTRSKLYKEIKDLIAWRDTVDDMLTVQHEVASEDPRESINRLINWNVTVSLDPSVSSGAKALVDQGSESLRDKFAARAMQALINKGFEGPMRGYEGWREEFSKEAYKFADAMLAVRNVK